MPAQNGGRRAPGTSVLRGTGRPVRSTEEAPMITVYACDYCGHQGRSRLPVDQVQCPMCGEPVTLVAEEY